MKIISVVLCCMGAFSGVSPARAQDYEALTPIKKNQSNRVSSVASTPLDLFFAKEPERRSQIDSIWKWDFWCQLQPKIGSCTNKVTAYYYDAQLDQCRTFGYSGCGGNNNNFKTLVECERHCKGTAYMPLKETTRTTYCGLQPNAGLCLALTERFYYDVNVARCKKFVYGGCGGNQNRFSTKNQCNDRCMEESNQHD